MPGNESNEKVNIPKLTRGAAEAATHPQLPLIEVTPGSGDGVCSDGTFFESLA